MEAKVQFTEEAVKEIKKWYYDMFGNADCYKDFNGIVADIIYNHLMEMHDEEETTISFKDEPTMYDNIIGIK